LQREATTCTAEVVIMQVSCTQHIQVLVPSFTAVKGHAITAHKVEHSITQSCRKVNH